MSEDGRSVRDELKDLKTDIAYMAEKFREREDGKKKEFKLPGKFKRIGRKAAKSGDFLGIVLKANKTIDFQLITLKGGLLKYAEYEFNAYESDAVYTYKKFPVVVIIEWRLLPVGGRTEKYKENATFDYDLVGGEIDKVIADKYGLTSYAQQTIIRAITIAKIEKEEGKKKGKFSLIWIIIVGVIAFYLILKALGMA